VHIGTVIVALALALVNPACQSPPATSAPPASPHPTGQGIREYRDTARLARTAVEDTIHSLKNLSHPHARGHGDHPALEDFDASLLRLEITSLKTRARAEAILARGRDYFEEWHQHLNGLTNAAAAHAGEKRYGRMHDHFVRIEEASAGVKTAFRPYLDQLRELRARFDRRPGLAPGATHPQELQEAIQSGRRVLQALDAVEAALHGAHGELRAVLSETAAR
jgi:hypothetical protein